jgi:hypothetical protein
MGKVSQKIQLQRAQEAFLRGDYGYALRMYGLILKDTPDIDEAKVGVYLSDLGLESPEEAQALFDYYLVIKDEKKDVVEIIDGLISSLDDSKSKLQALLSEPLAEQVEYADGIRYSDFEKLIESRGSFKEAFEDIMFSTRVVITDKYEFIDFVTQLAQEGFDEMALGYLDATSTLFGDDQDILALYSMVDGVKHEDNI